MNLRRRHWLLLGAIVATTVASIILGDLGSAVSQVLETVTPWRQPAGRWSSPYW